MAKRKTCRRSRRKQVAHQTQETLLQKWGSSDAIDATKIKSISFNKETGSTERLLRFERSPESVLFESQLTDCSHFKDLSPEIVPKCRQVKLNLIESDENEADGNSKIQNLPELNNRLQIDLSEKNINKLTETCFPLDKTLSLNDEVKLEMNACSSMQADKSENSNDSNRSPKSSYPSRLHSSESDKFLKYNSEMESRDRKLHHFLDDLQSLSVYESTERADDNDEKDYEQRENHFEFEIVNEKNPRCAGEGRCTESWITCRRILSNLSYLKSFTMHPKYKKLEEEAFLRTYSFGNQSSTSVHDSSKRIAKRSLTETDESADKANDREDYTAANDQVSRIREPSTTPCRGSSPSAKRCRTTLRFDEVEEMDEHRQPAARVQIDHTLMEKKKSDQNNSTRNTTTKTNWSSDSGSPTDFVLDLPVVSDSGACSTCSHGHERDVECSKRCACNSFQRKYSARRYPGKSVAKIFLFCAWLVEKLSNMIKVGYKNFKRMMSWSTATKEQVAELQQIVTTLRSDNEQMINTFLQKVSHLSAEVNQVSANNATALSTLTAEVSGMREVSENLAGSNQTLMQELQKLHQKLENARLKSPEKPVPAPPPPPPFPPVSISSTLASAPLLLPPPPPPLPPPPPPPPPLPSFLSIQSPALPFTPTTPNGNRTARMPSTKCSTPLLNRPAITVEDLLKVTLKKAPQNVKENRRNTIPGPRGPVISLDMLRSVKLKSARRRTHDHITRSPRSGRVTKSRIAPSISLSPIGTESSLGRILKQVDVNKRGPRRLLSGSSSFRESILSTEKNNQNKSAKDTGSQSAIAFQL